MVLGRFIGLRAMFVPFLNNKLKIIYSFSIILCYILFTPNVLAKTTPWKEAISKDGITVETRSIDGYDVKEYRASMTVPNYSGLEKKVIDLVTKAESYPSWNYRATHAITLKEKGRHKYAYLVLSHPLLQEREIVVHTFVHKPTVTDRGFRSVKVSMKKTDEIPLSKNHKDRIPMKYFVGSWEVTSLPGNRLKIVQQVVTSPGGNVPDWLVNIGLTEDPYKIFKALRSLLKR